MEQNRNSDTFCILPFIHVNSSVTGKVRPCCNTFTSFNFTDRDKSLQEAFVSEEMNQLREDLNSGKRPSICNVCWNNEEKGMRSQRQVNNLKFENYTESGLQFLDVKFDNKCNLQCRMCDPYSSNQIWKTLNEVEEVPNHLKHINLTEEQYNLRDNSENRKKYVIEALPTLRFLKCTGGEPFVSNHFIEVLHKAVATGDSKHITLSITTNGTKFNRKITELFEHFEAIDVNISVDGTENTYDFIRYPFKWKQWHDRVIDFLTDMEQMNHPKFRFRFSTVVSAYNFLNLCSLQLALDEFYYMFPTLNGGLEKVNHFDFDLKPISTELHAKWLPNHLLKLERDKARELFNIKYSVHPLSNLEKFVESCLTEMPCKNKNDSDTILKNEKKKELIKSTITIDKVRKQDYKTLHPRLVQWLDE